MANLLYGVFVREHVLGATRRTDHFHLNWHFVVGATLTFDGNPTNDFCTVRNNIATVHMSHPGHGPIADKTGVHTAKFIIQGHPLHIYSPSSVFANFHGTFVQVKVSMSFAFCKCSFKMVQHVFVCDGD
jgi:hypothetical protein